VPYEPMKMVAEFNDLYGAGLESTAPDRAALMALRRRLIEEECQEAVAELSRLERAVHDGTDDRAARVALVKELADLLYVTYGCAQALGLDLEGAFEEVHRSNLSKLGADGQPVRRADGKILKGPDYREADVARFI
jgi:predicted HAD superfamily Cof-like phosphohydrolase